MLRASVLSAVLGIAALGGLAATASQAEARPWRARVYVGYPAVATYGYTASAPAVSYYYDPLYTPYVVPEYSYYSPGYYSYFYSAPAYGYRSFYYPGHYHHQWR